MAYQAVSVTLTAEATKDFDFDTPVGDYGKVASITITDGNDPVAYSFAPDDVVGGTTTGTINLTAPLTGTVEVLIYDKPS